jgi:hypothetical protein
MLNTFIGIPFSLKIVPVIPFQILFQIRVMQPNKNAAVPKFTDAVRRSTNHHIQIQQMNSSKNRVGKRHLCPYESEQRS